MSISAMSRRIRELRALEKQLKVLREQCSEANAAADCGILKGLSGEMAADRPAPKSRKHVHGTH